MAPQNLTHNPPNSKPNLITPQQALVLAARACHSILFGQPAPATFDREDLSQTVDILTQMATTIEVSP
jgi:hypothetical protein